MPNSEQKHLNFVQNGRCRQVSMTFATRFRRSLVVVDRWSLFRGSFSTKIAWAGFRVVVVGRWLLFGGLTVLALTETNLAIHFSDNGIRLRSNQAKFG